MQSSLQYSIAGIINENMLDAIITPPAKACIIDSKFIFIFLMKKIVAAPKHEITKHKRENKNAYNITLPPKSFYKKYLFFVIIVCNLIMF